MKIICPYCKTEYNAENASGRVVACLCCAHVWQIPHHRKNSWLLLLATLVALLAALIFAAAAISKSKHKNQEPLIAELNSPKSIVDTDGKTRLMVSGHINNQSDKIYGVPDLIIKFQNNQGKVIGTEKILSPVPLLDAGESIKFNKTVELPIGVLKKISVEFAE